MWMLYFLPFFAYLPLHCLVIISPTFSPPSILNFYIISVHSDTNIIQKLYRKDIKNSCLRGLFLFTWNHKLMHIYVTGKQYNYVQTICISVITPLPAGAHYINFLKPNYSWPVIRPVVSDQGYYTFHYRYAKQNREGERKEQTNKHGLGSAPSARKGVCDTFVQLSVHL